MSTEWWYFLMGALAATTVWLSVLAIQRSRSKRMGDVLAKIARQGAGLVQTGRFVDAELSRLATMAEDPDMLAFHIHLADWGPDFTGEAGVLPRWRWTIWDADHEEATGSPSDFTVMGYDVPYFLGNAATHPVAISDAKDWIFTSFGPSQIEVVFGEHQKADA